MLRNLFINQLKKRGLLIGLGKLSAPKLLANNSVITSIKHCSGRFSIKIESLPDIKPSRTLGKLGNTSKLSNAL